MIYVKDFIPAEIRSELTHFNFKESVWVDIKINETEKI